MWRYGRGVVITEEYNVTANSEELIGTTEYVTLWTRCRYNRVRLSLCWKPFPIMLMIYEAQCDALNNFVPYVVHYAMFVVQKYRNNRTWLLNYDCTCGFENQQDNQNLKGTIM